MRCNSECEALSWFGTGFQPMMLGIFSKLMEMNSEKHSENS